MRILVLGGTRFVGRAIVTDAVARGHDVTVVSRGASGSAPDGTTWVSVDRTVPGALAALLAGPDSAAIRWDAVVDTWSDDPAVVEESAALLAGHADWYGYVSSRSVYRWPLPVGSDESAPVVEVTDVGDPGAGYAVNKRAAELAVERHFPGRCLLARAGLILGPHEDVGRLTWWLQRAAAGGAMVAPQPADEVWQLIDARDLAAFMLDAATARTAGAFNVVGPRSDEVTTERLLTACVEATGRRTRLEWVALELLARAGIAEWDGLPGWIPPGSESAGMHDCDVSAAIAAGLRCRPVEETVKDTWEWMQALPPRERHSVRAGLPRRGVTAEQEQSVWWLTRRGAASLVPDGPL